MVQPVMMTVGIASIGFKACLVTLFTFFFGAWYGSTIVPLFAPQLLGTPAGTMHTWIVSALVFAGLTLLLYLYDHVHAFRG
jgi:hypothetical protein